MSISLNRSSLGVRSAGTAGSGCRVLQQQPLVESFVELASDAFLLQQALPDLTQHALVVSPARLCPQQQVALPAAAPLPQHEGALAKTGAPKMAIASRATPIRFARVTAMGRLVSRLRSECGCIVDQSAR